MMMTYDIKSIDELVTALGGEKAVAKMFGISQPAVANWKGRGEIPSGWHLRLWALVSERGLNVDPRIVGLTVQQAKKLRAPLSRMSA